MTPQELNRDIKRLYKWFLKHRESQDTSDTLHMIANGMEVKC